VRATIVYWTKTGHTERAARIISEALTTAGAETTLVNLRRDEPPDPANCDLLVVGSPCHAGSMKFMGTGIVVPVQRFLRSLPSSALAGKRAAAFAVHAGYGGDRTIASLERLLRDAGAQVAETGPVVKAGAPLSIVVGPMASEADCEALRRFGRALAITPA